MKPIKRISEHALNSLTLEDFNHTDCYGELVKAEVFRWMGLS